MKDEEKLYNKVEEANMSHIQEANKPLPQWTKLSDALGTNPGGWWKDEKGEKWYVKQYLNENQVRGEFLANQIYSEFKIPVADVWLLWFTNEEGETKWTLASKEIKDGEVLSRKKRNGHIVRDIKALRESKDVIDGFIIDCWLSNYDATGLGNIIRVKTRHREVHEGIAIDYSTGFRDIRLDNGGCMFWSAKGNRRKDYFWENPMACPDIDDFRDKEFGNGRPGKIFCKLSDSDIKEQVKHFASVFDDMNIDQLVKGAEFKEVEYETKTIFYLQARRDAILDWAKV